MRFGLRRPIGAYREFWNTSDLFFIHSGLGVILKGFTSFQRRQSDRNNISSRLGYKTLSFRFTKQLETWLSMFRGILSVVVEFQNL